MYILYNSIWRSPGCQYQHLPITTSSASRSHVPRASTSPDLRNRPLHSCKLTWKWRGAPNKTTILYIGPSISFHVNLGEGKSHSCKKFQVCSLRKGFGNPFGLEPAIRSSKGGTFPNRAKLAHARAACGDLKLRPLFIQQPIQNIQLPS